MESITASDLLPHINTDMACTTAMGCVLGALVGIELVSAKKAENKAPSIIRGVCLFSGFWIYAIQASKQIHIEQMLTEAPLVNKFGNKFLLSTLCVGAILGVEVARMREQYLEEKKVSFGLRPLMASFALGIYIRYCLW